MNVVNETQIEERAKAMSETSGSLEASKVLEETPICDREAVLREAVKMANYNAASHLISSRYLVNVEITDDQKKLELVASRPTFFGLGETQLIPVLNTTVPIKECKK
jgi:hypothetical protein